jgi:hypothetical protein
MANFEVVDLTAQSATRAGGTKTAVVGSLDSTELADALAVLRDDMDSLFESEGELKLKSVVIKLAIGAEGKVAFIAKGTAEASVELTFERS